MDQDDFQTPRHLCASFQGSRERITATEEYSMIFQRLVKNTQKAGSLDQRDVLILAVNVSPVHIMALTTSQ